MSYDPSYGLQGDQEQHLIQQSKLNDLVPDVNLFKQWAELTESKQMQWNLLAKGI